MLGSGSFTTWEFGSALTGNSPTLVNNNNKDIYINKSGTILNKLINPGCKSEGVSVLVTLRYALA
jgi:hypothetical protein